MRQKELKKFATEIEVQKIKARNGYEMYGMESKNSSKYKETFPCIIRYYAHYHVCKILDKRNSQIAAIIDSTDNVTPKMITEMMTPTTTTNIDPPLSPASYHLTPFMDASAR